MQKKPVDAVTLVVEHGIEDDAHAGPWHRQVSLLADESAQKMRDAGGDVDVGDFGENITTEGIRVCDLPVGARLRLGPALVEVTQIGKECHAHCAIYHQVGDCVMPREGIFVRVLEGGEVKAGDEILVEKKSLIHAAVLTSSDKGARGERDDTSGDVLEEALREMGVAHGGAGDRARRGRPDRRRAAPLGRRDAGQPHPDDRRHRHDQPGRDARGHARRCSTVRRPASPRPCAPARSSRRRTPCSRAR